MGGTDCDPEEEEEEEEKCEKGSLEITLKPEYARNDDPNPPASVLPTTPSTLCRFDSLTSQLLFYPTLHLLYYIADEELIFRQIISPNGIFIKEQAAQIVVPRLSWNLIHSAPGRSAEAWKIRVSATLTEIRVIVFQTDHVSRR